MKGPIRRAAGSTVLGECWGHPAACRLAVPWLQLFQQGRDSLSNSREVAESVRTGPGNRILCRHPARLMFPCSRSFEPVSRVVEILVSDSPSAPMVARECVRAVAGAGLEGDRYFRGNGTFSPSPQKPDFEVTLVERERVDAFAQASQLPFNARDARRNIVTEGVDLNALVGREFSIADVVLRGIRLCEPCNHLARSTCQEVLEGLAGRGGLRAQIVSGGVIRVGDTLRTREPAGPSGDA